MGDHPDAGYLEQLLGELAGRGVRFVVAGGVAAVLHGVERTTLDLDIALELTPENVRRFADVMASLGLRPLVPVPVEALADPEAVRTMVEEKNAIVFMLAGPEMPLRKVGVLLTASLSYESLVTDSLELEMPGIALRVVTAERLLELKRAVDPPRDKDLYDIRALERITARGAGDA